MKTQKESTTPIVRNKYTAQFKERALERADRDGIPKVAQDLGLAESMLYSWRSKRRQTGQPFDEQKLQVTRKKYPPIFFSEIIRQSMYSTSIVSVDRPFKFMTRLSTQFITTIKDASQKLTGAKRRAFQAQVAIDYLNAKPSLAEKTFGWDRRTVALGLNELRSGMVCVDNFKSLVN